MHDTRQNEHNGKKCMPCIFSALGMFSSMRASHPVRVHAVHAQPCFTKAVQWNLSIAVSHGPEIFGLNKEVAGMNWRL